MPPRRHGKVPGIEATRMLEDEAVFRHTTLPEAQPAQRDIQSTLGELALRGHAAKAEANSREAGNAWQLGAPRRQGIRQAASCGSAWRSARGRKTPNRDRLSWVQWWTNGGCAHAT